MLTLAVSLVNSRLNFGICIFVGLLSMLIAQNSDNCMGRENRDWNIALSSLQQYFFGAAGCFICAEAFATFGVSDIGSSSSNLTELNCHLN